MKSSGVTIQRKPFWQKFCTLLFICQDFAKWKLIFLVDCFLANISRERVISCETCGQRRKISLARVPLDGSCGLMMYKTMNDFAPQYLRSLFSQRHSAYNLRNSEGRLTLSKPSTNYLKRSFSYSGAMLWNNLPKSLKNAASVEHFKRNIKKVADISDSHTAIM